MKAYAVVALAAAVSLGTVLAILQSKPESPALARGPMLGNVEVLRSSYAEWKAAQNAAGGSRSIVLGLGWTKAFSAGLAQGSGRASFDLVDGTIDVEISEMCDGDPLDIWMIENVEGAGRSLVPEEGDRMIKLGRLVQFGDLRTLHRMPAYLTPRQRELAADFLARFSGLVASAPWKRFTLEVNPLKLGADACAAVDGLLIIE